MLRLSKAQASLALHSACTLILIITCLYLDCLILERLLDEFRCSGVVALILPATYIEEVLVVALGFAFLRLILLAEMSAAGFVTMESVISNQLTHEQEVAQVDSLVELHVETFLRSGDEEVGVELLLQFLDELNRRSISFSTPFSASSNSGRSVEMRGQTSWSAR